MTIHVVMNFTLSATKIDAFKDLLRRHLPDARTFDGCESAAVIANQDDDANIVILEIWASRSHFEKYIAWRTDTGVLGELVACCVDGPVMNVFDPLEI